MKLCCLPVRPLLYTLAILGILPSGAQIYWTSNITREIVPITYILFNAFLIFAVYRKDEQILRWAQKVIVSLRERSIESGTCLFLSQVVVIIASLVPILLLPVLSASYIASGKMHFVNNSDTRFFEKHASSSRFFNGAVFGFVVEAVAFLSVGGRSLSTPNYSNRSVEIAKYVLISRIWRLETEEQFVNSDVFKAV